MTLKKHELSIQIKHDIEAWAKKFPQEQRQAVLIYALKRVQAENGGYLTEDLMDLVADYLKLPKIAVYEVATFYSMFELKPVGRYKICVCTNISCMLRNANVIVDHLKKRLNINFKETTRDGQFTLKAVECLAACGAAPVMQVNDHYYENLTPEKVDLILEQLKKEG